jgi:hypothetical protein
MNNFWFSYRGLSPHKFTPVPGVHNLINLTGNSRAASPPVSCRQVISALGAYVAFPIRTKMDEIDWWRDLKERLEVFVTQAASSLIDSGFLALWVIVQWAMNEYVVNRLKLSGIDKWVLLAFQVVFALSTLAPVVMYIYVDIRVMILKAQRRIRREKQLSIAKDSNNE